MNQKLFQVALALRSFNEAVDLGRIPARHWLRHKRWQADNSRFPGVPKNKKTSL
jgi:hypothetical protein